ncbi:sulfurtransferase [Phytoactinopolyspora mesophila]|nr:sulfurtransferase [Phytoactinopolyspora mesophila]
MSVLMGPDELHGLLTDGFPVVLLDVRWKLGAPHGLEQYRSGHLPGAVFVDLETELAAPASPEEGRHPLPAIMDLEHAARRWGVCGDSLVVAYDDNAAMSAARAWWLLRWGGFSEVRLLDGGLGAWRRAGYPLESGDVRPEPGDVVLRPGAMPVLDADDAAVMAHGGVLLDARAAERYRGETEPVDPRAGHIPGALSAPTTENLDADGRFRPVAELQQRFATLGVEAGAPAGVGVYCGSGITAAHEVAALELAGVRAALYPGSWSQWSCDPERPAAASRRSGDH